MYATKQDLIDRYGERELIELTDRVAGEAIIDAVVDHALADADAMIDAYIGARYVLPLPTTPTVLNGTACDIARYRLHEDTPSDAVRVRYEQAIKLLVALSRGDAKLDIAGTAPPASPGGPHVATGERVFSAASLRDY